MKKMLKAFLRNILDDNEKEVKRYRKRVEAINALESKYEQLKPEDFPGRLKSFGTGLIMENL